MQLDCHDWRTAGVLNHSRARLFIGRLNQLGIDHAVSQEEIGLRVSVRRDDLEAAIELRPEPKVTAPAARKHRKNPLYRSYVRMLITIPLGAIAGGLIGLSMGSYWPALPSLSAIALTGVVEAIAACR